jgi:hypothetical protein
MNTEYNDIKQELFARYGVESFSDALHAGAETAYRIAWEKGHAYGAEEVASHFVDMLEIIKTIKNHNE